MIFLPSYDEEGEVEKSRSVLFIEAKAHKY
jgi:hypothetical protein